MTSGNEYLSLPSADSQNEDWDRSTPEPRQDDSSQATENSPRSQQGEARKRTLSELLKLHAEKGKDLDMSAEEASAVAEVLGRWVSGT